MKITELQVADSLNKESIRQTEPSRMILSTQKTMARFMCCFCLICVLCACGGSDSANSGNIAPASAETGSASISIQWHDRSFAPYSAGPQELSRAALDCEAAGIKTIYCDVYDDSDTLIATGGPWSCSEHSGEIDQIPAGMGRRFVVLGMDEDGMIIYQGKTEAVVINPRQINTLNPIYAYPFVPRLISPEDGENVKITGFSFVWEAIGNAEIYNFTIARDDDFSKDRQDHAVPKPVNPIDSAIIEFKTNNLNKDSIYFWKVYAVDQFGNESADSAVRQFRTDPNHAPDVLIDQPEDGDTFALGQFITFKGHADDPEDGSIPGTALSWFSNQDDWIGTGENIQIKWLDLGTHHITLYATDSSGNTAQTSISISVTDQQAPAMPRELKARSVSGYQIDLSWKASSDNVGVTGYRLYRDEKIIGTSASTFFQSTGLKPGTRYCFTVSAFDAARNESDTSDPACEKTLKDDGPDDGLDDNPPDNPDDDDDDDDDDDHRRR